MQQEYISRINTLLFQQDKLKCKNYEAQDKLSVFLQKVVQLISAFESDMNPPDESVSD